MMVSNAVLWPLSRWVNEKLVPEKHRSMSTKIVRVSSPWGRPAWRPCLHCLMSLVPDQAPGNEWRSAAGRLTCTLLLLSCTACNCLVMLLTYPGDDTAAIWQKALRSKSSAPLAAALQIKHWLAVGCVLTLLAASLALLPPIMIICRTACQGNAHSTGAANIADLHLSRCLQVVWSAWLSTLGHAPSIADLADQGGFSHTVSDMVLQFVPVSRAQVCPSLLALHYTPC